MIVQLYSGDTLVYDNRKPEKALLSLSVLVSLTDAGSASFSLAPTHPLITGLEFDEVFVPFKSVIRVLRDIGDGSPQIFRGRVIGLKADMYDRRTVTCEGERAFFNDSVILAGTYTGSASTLMNSFLTAHNSQVDSFKQFTLGTVDTSSSVTIELAEAVSTLEALRKLTDQLGGYITFGQSGTARTVTWISSLPQNVSDQDIRFGSNLLNYTSELNIKDFATRVYAFGAKDENGNRLTMAVGFNNYLDNTAAQAVYGIVSKAVIFNDISNASVLSLTAARWLASASAIARTISVSALDLSILIDDQALVGIAASDTWTVGKLVHVVSAPHALDANYVLTARQYDLLDPSKDRLTLGTEPVTLTGALI